MMETRKQVIELNIDDVLPNRFQPRIKFNEDAINELSKSIKEHGVIQPIVVRPIGDKFEIIAGERRYKASRMAGKATIPAIITDLNDKDSAEVALIENVQRENLTPIEEAISYKKILDMGYITQDALATKLGKTQSTVANKLRLLNLEDDVQEALLNEKISERHARSLLRLTDKNQQKQMLNRIINERLTVRRADEEIDKMLTGETTNFNDNNTVAANEPQKNAFDIPSAPTSTPQQEENTNKFNFNFDMPSVSTSTPVQEETPSQPETFKFFNPIPPQQEEIEEEPQENIKDEDELQPKKFFNLLENEPQEEKTEETAGFNKMFINPSNSTENPLLEEVNEIENSINNSNSLPPIENNIEQKEEPKTEKPQEDKYDDFDDDMEFIEEEPNETINSNIESNDIIIPQDKIGNFKEVLEEIRNCSKKIEDSGFQIETEEINLDGEYQIIFKIKNN